MKRIHITEEENKSIVETRPKIMYYFSIAGIWGALGSYIYLSICKVITSANFNADNILLPLIVFLAFYMISIKRIVYINRNEKYVEIISQNIIYKKTINLKFDEIESCSMSYGRGGNYAKGGSAVLILKSGQQLMLSNSDLGFKSSVDENKNLVIYINNKLK